MSDAIRSRRLINCPRPYADESIHGYILRVAAANGYDQPSWLLGLTETPASFAIVPTDLSALAKLLDVPTEDLEDSCYWPVGPGRTLKNRNFHGASVPGLTISRCQPRICPKCLSEDEYVRALWDLSPVACCPIHGVRLVDRCGHCGASIKRNRRTISECHNCGKNLLEVPVSPAPRNAVEITAMTAKKAGFELPPTEGLEGTPAALDDLELGIFLRVIAFLGATKTGVRQGEGRWLPARLTLPETIEVASKAAEVLSKWPQNYFLLLDEIRTRSETRPSGAGLEREFGGFYLALANSLRNDGAAFLWDAFEEYVGTQWDGGFISAKNTRIKPSRRHSERFVTRAKAARLLGTRPERIERLVDAGVLKGNRRRQKERTLLLVETGSVEEYQNMRGNHISLKDACARLGLSKTAVLQLVRKRLLRPIKPHRGGVTAYEARNVDELLEAVLGQRLPGPSRNRDYMSMTDAMRRLSSVGLNAGDLVLAILSGRLPVAGRDENRTGLAQCLFRAADVTSMVDQQSEKPNGVFTIPEAAIELGLKQQSTYDLVKAGLLETSLARVRNRIVRTVCEDAVERFGRTYISASDLATREGVSPGQIVRDFKGCGVTPVTGPSVDGARQYFFLRSATHNGTGGKSSHPDTYLGL